MASRRHCAQDLQIQHVVKFEYSNHVGSLGNFFFVSLFLITERRLTQKRLANSVN